MSAANTMATPPSYVLGPRRADWTDWLNERLSRGGGVRELLAACLHADPDWLNAGLRRLWALAVVLPGTARREMGAPSAKPTTCTLDPSGDLPPEPLAMLHEALLARGLDEVVLTTWREPPNDPPLGRYPDFGRARHLRNWLGPTWARRAPIEEVARFLEGNEPFHFDTLNVLRARGWSDLRAIGERMAAMRGANFAVLAMVAPERIVPAFRDHLDWRSRIHPGATPRIPLDSLMFGVSRPRWECPSVLRELRELVMALPEPEASTADPGTTLGE